MKKNIFLSFIYAIGQITLGLVLHPYQTMQSLVEEKVFVWLTLLPMGLLAILTVLWRFIIVPVVQTVFSCQASGFVLCNFVTFLSNWITFFCLYWQVMLFYLLFRFKSVAKDFSHLREEKT